MTGEKALFFCTFVLKTNKNRKELKVSRRDDNFLIDINPHGGEIVVY